MIVFILVFLYIGVAIATIVSVSRFEIIAELIGDSKYTESDSGIVMVWGIFWPIMWLIWVAIVIWNIGKIFIHEIMER